MDAFLGSITQHAVSYAIRSGIAITSAYTIRQCSRLLKKVEDDPDYEEIRILRERLISKTKILDPAIDMIDMISARGNTTLTSAKTLTKDLRWEIQAFGVRLSRASAAAQTENPSKPGIKGVKLGTDLKTELDLIVLDMRQLLSRIDDAVPLINLAITTSGASLSTSLAPTVSPSRLLQASLFLSRCDETFLQNPTSVVQVGPDFVVSLYMLFAGHRRRSQEQETDLKNTTWKEVIHKARVKLVRVPFDSCTKSIELAHTNRAGASKTRSPSPTKDSDKISNFNEEFVSVQGVPFSYELQIIEDLDDGRMHTFDKNEPQPGPYQDVAFAGIRECIPVHQFARIFYADTGRILNIGMDADLNNPVLLLKRDVSSQHPLRMMLQSEQSELWNQYEDGDDDDLELSGDMEGEDPQTDVDRQLFSDHPNSSSETQQEDLPVLWDLPADLDPEWLALEIFTETEDDTSEDESTTERSASPSTPQNLHQKHQVLPSPSLTNGKTSLNNSSTEVPSTPDYTKTLAPAFLPDSTPTSLYGPIKSAISLLDMLLRLTNLQQVQQTSHLCVPDEFLTFFLREAANNLSPTGEQRRRNREQAKSKLGFDPYDDTPVKSREQRPNNFQKYDHAFRADTLLSDRNTPDQSGRLHNNRYPNETPYMDYDSHSTFYEDELSHHYSDSIEKRFLQGREGSSSGNATRRLPKSSIESSPLTPSVPRRAMRPFDRVQHQGRDAGARSSPLGRGRSVETDSSLGTSPGSPPGEADASEIGDLERRMRSKLAIAERN